MSYRVESNERRERKLSKTSDEYSIYNEFMLRGKSLFIILTFYDIVN